MAPKMSDASLFKGPSSLVPDPQMHLSQTYASQKLPTHPKTPLRTRDLRSSGPRATFGVTQKEKGPESTWGRTIVRSARPVDVRTIVHSGRK